MEENKFMKPLDALGNALGREVIVKTKNGLEISGTLKAFDMHVNIVLGNVRFKDKDTEGNIIEKRVEQIFIRGDMIVMVI
ncbi:MAG: small nuclear ribonucleoprotein [Candidatus Altiarchaeales archaeon HGW-Altiarchaeales-1]|nr:MAG: small nuclear ribonucleoprotein [Candidatus Altiarchaeales archaeon HGW-Altiarchaeales-1]